MVVGGLGGGEAGGFGEWVGGGGGGGGAARLRNRSAAKSAAGQRLSFRRGSGLIA